MWHSPGIYWDKLGPEQIVHLASVEALYAEGLAQWIILDHCQLDIARVEQLVPLQDDVFAQQCSYLLIGKDDLLLIRARDCQQDL